MSEILVEITDGIAVITIDRPRKRNALTLAMWRDLCHIFHELTDDITVKAAILTGSGGNFCAGADIAEFPEVRATAEQGAIYADIVDATGLAISRLPKPTIAAVAGHAVGGGCGLALACDFRVAHSSASFGIPAARLGIVYGIEETRHLLELVGVAQAKRLLFSGTPVNARDAREIGLADEVVEDDVVAAAKLLAAQFMSNAPLSIAGAKVVLREVASGLPDQGAVDEAMRSALESEDLREAVRAFKLKRPPNFTGR